MSSAIRVGVQAGMLTDGHGLLELARKAEASGFDGLYASDHPGVSGSPFVTLAAAAAVTSTLRLGTYVCNTGVRDPVQIASDAATFDVVSDGRFVLGLGAGHTPVEWTMGGRTYPTAMDRVDRFSEVIEVVTRVLAGEVVTFDGRFVKANDAFLLSPRPVQDVLPVLVGGNGKRLLRTATCHADIVSLTGLGRLLNDGHRHTADWTSQTISDRVTLVRETTANRSAVVLDALVQHVEVTGDRSAAAERMASSAAGLTPADVRGAPYALIGTVDQIADEMLQHQDRWGFTSFTVRDTTIDDMAAVIARLDD